MNSFLGAFIHYWQELWFVLFIGFLLSGIVYLFMPTNSVEKYLGQKGVRPILISSVIGATLPVCCLGSLPIAVTLKKKGASIGAVIAFLIATPATSVSALIVCWKLMGMVFTVLIFFAAVLMGGIAGILANNIKFDDVSSNVSESQEKKSCCHSDKMEPSQNNEGVGRKIIKVLQYSFVTLPKDMGFEIILGIALASAIAAFEPVQAFINDYLTGVIGYIFVVFVGLVTYVCSTASVPMAHAFLNSGMTSGQALCYLLIGPITSYGTILVVKKNFGSKILILYLSVICIFSLTIGLIYDIIQHLL